MVVPATPANDPKIHRRAGQIKMRLVPDGRGEHPHTQRGERPRLPAPADRDGRQDYGDGQLDGAEDQVEAPVT
ncbi:uncharacterized protein PG986_011655 [Apiospora aurea]|uniref:Uncharacterized protein n=1 Tax=Apiospora aurea TaxID=335848 RepID=A0ABR1PXR5_9PEZI